MRTLLAALAILSLSGGWYALGDEEFALVEDEPFVFRPSVAAELTFDSRRSNVGWGSFDLSAAPEHDDIRVDVLVGTPSSEMHWHQCRELLLRFDGQETTVQARWAGVRMQQSGVFDAVSAALSIEHVRALADAQEATAELCGESIELSPATRLHLRSFIENFDDIATYPSPSAPTPKPVLSPEHDYFPAAPRWRPIPA